MSRPGEPLEFVRWPKPPIPQAIRDELDRTPRWWIGLFHDALLAVRAPHVDGDHWEMRTWSGGVISWTERGYPDCPCTDCRRICS